MRRLIFPVVALLLIVAVSGGLAGCAVKEADKPRERWAVAATTYVATLRGLTALANAGKLDEPTVEKIERIRAHARNMLDAADQVLNDAGRVESDALYYIDEAARFVLQLVDIERRHRADTAPGPPGGT